MKVDPLAQALDDEFKRVAHEEDMAMSDLVEEVAALTSLSPRHLYNLRSGKWSIPARIIPVVSRRFRSTALITALRGQMSEPPSMQIECSEISERAMNLLKRIIDHHSALLDKISSPALDANDLLRLEESTERIIQSERELYACVEIELASRQEQKRKVRA